jgi:hypothetical protein
MDDFDNWIKGLPHIWRLNPCLCVFVTVKENTSSEDFQAYMENCLDKDTLKTLDNALVLPESAHIVSPLMRPKVHMSKRPVESRDVVDVISSINQRFTSLALPLSDGGKDLKIQPESIDIGRGAVSAAGSWEGQTYADKNNPANGTGTLDTWELWCITNATGVEVATFYVVSGNNLSTRDSESIGSVTSGSKQTFSGLSTDVATGDYAGYYSATGGIAIETSGYLGSWYKTGDYITCSNTAFSVWADVAISIYATGTEPPIEVSITDGLKIGGSDSIVSSLTRTESLSVASARTATMEANVNRTDGLKADSTNLESATGEISITEALSIGSDNAENMDASSVVTDGVKIGATDIIDLLASLNLADGLKVGDAAIAGLLAELSRSEGVKVSDTTVAEMAASLTVTDALTLADSIIATMEATLSRTEELNLADISGIGILRMLYVSLKLYRRTLATLEHKKNLAMKYRRR